MSVTILLKNICKNYSLQLALFSLILIFAGIIEAVGLVFLAPIFDNILGNDLTNSSFLTKKIYLIFSVKKP